MLTKLKVMTTTRAEDVDDIKLVVGVYLEALSEYPADVVRHVLTTHAKMSKWWPSWQELAERLDLHTERRHRLSEILEAKP